MRIFIAVLVFLQALTSFAEAQPGSCSFIRLPPLESLDELVQFAPPLWKNVSQEGVHLRRACDSARGSDSLSAFSRADGVRVFRGRDRSTSSTVYLAFIDWTRTRIEVRYGAALMPTSRLAQDCLLGLNGGYFSGTKSMSLVVHRGQIIAEDAQRLSRPRGYAFPTRGAVIFDFWTGRPQVIWASVFEGNLLGYSMPVDPYSSDRKSGSSLGSAFEAIGAGPMLVKKGEMIDTLAREAFDAGIAPNVPSPRTALALLENGNVGLVVVDGRSEWSRGQTLGELSQFLVRLGARDALNLDGGGSSTLVGSSQVLNRPSDGMERPVKSALCFGEAFHASQDIKEGALER